MYLFLGAARSPAPRCTEALSEQTSYRPSRGGHHGGRARACGRQHDSKNIQQRHSECCIHWSDASVQQLLLVGTTNSGPLHCAHVLSSGLHLPPVSPEDHRHQDLLPQRGLPRDSGSVLRAVSEEPVRGGCQKGSA